MAVGDTHVSWLSHTSTNTNFFQKPPTTFLTCFSRGERRKYAIKKFRLNRLTIEPSRRKHTSTNTTFLFKAINYFSQCFSRGERRKYSAKKVRLNPVSNSQPPGHKSDRLTTEPSGQGLDMKKIDR